ncbi:MAG: hypothetical protein KJO76_10825 [Gammaproteobacteria bacterium]|nr:hypothetical protein [Gammaproteobacteria bacterium]MBT8445370.1 hypothetical protein [Gammaproteobacteria bacterium]NND37794.1 hypothetical protein [Gammaproteobacteria bacterium]
MKRILFTILVSLLTLSGCGGSAQVKSNWSEARERSGPFGSILVVGISESARQRRRFENALTEQLDKKGITAWASNRIMPVGAEINRENVMAAVGKTSATAVVVTQLVDQEISTKKIPGRTEMKSGTSSGFFSYDYDEYEEEGQLQVRSSVTLLTEVYEIHNGALIYYIRSTSTNKRTDVEILDEQTLAIAKRLKRDRVVR